MNKSSATHMEIRNSRNFQRGNTIDQRISKAIALVLDDHPKQMINVVKELKNNAISYLNYAGAKGYRCIYFFKDNNNGQENKILITINEKLGNQTIEINNQETQDRYLAECIPNETLAKEIKSIMKFLATGNPDKNSKLKISNFEDMMDDFDPNGFLPDEVVEKTGFDQKIRDKILAEEGEEEAAKYGKGLRGETK